MLPPASTMTFDILEQHTMGEPSISLKRKLSFGGMGTTAAQAWPCDASQRQRQHQYQDQHGLQAQQGCEAIAASITGSGATRPAAGASAASTRSKKSAEVVKLADWFAKMVCYIWFAPCMPSVIPKPVTPAHSPLASYAPLHPAPSTPSLSPTFPTGQKNSPNRHFAPNGSMSVQFVAELKRRDLQPEGQAPPRAFTGSPSSHSPLVRSAMIRLKPQASFISFAREVLNTTQLSMSVVLCALLYIYRFKSMHPHVKGREGSEYRLAIVGLMLANKFLDDNTYTNKTWSEISNMRLNDITRMEIEFWSGLGMSIHVTEQEFMAWTKWLEVITEQRTQSLARREKETMATSSRTSTSASAWMGITRSPSLQPRVGAFDLSLAGTQPAHFSKTSSPLRSMAPPFASAHSSPLRAFSNSYRPPLFAFDLHLPNGLPPLPSVAPVTSPRSAIGRDTTIGATSELSSVTSSRFWSDAVSPGASSHTSAPNGALRISISPPSARLDDSSRHAASAAQAWSASRRRSASSWCDGSGSFMPPPLHSASWAPVTASAPGSSHGLAGNKRTFGSLESDTSSSQGSALSPTWNVSQTKRVAASADNAQRPYYSLAAPLSNDHQQQQQQHGRAMRAAPAHNYNLRSMRRSTMRQMSPLAHAGGSSLFTGPSAHPRTVAANSGHSSAGTSLFTFTGDTAREGSLVPADAATAAAAAAAAMNHYHSLFAQHDSQTPNMLVAPFQAREVREPRALTYYQLASGVAQGIPSYHLPNNSYAQAPTWNPAPSAVPTSWAGQLVATGQAQEQVLQQQASADFPLASPVKSYICNQQAQPSMQPRMLDVASCAPTSWDISEIGAWQQEPFNNAQEHVDHWPLQLPAAFVRRSPSQLL
ncbi:hypothetical protein K437DRAFT_125825 [Tilletiaria anomala UBC 951]|uniref:Cyclin N-terminal domain-containing protein n=1 Tax=Tilletiaria anomala (strain ATCC 24038 / CBS 436.72 / UBC 951) TaxID=1037660 RepID=A0A066VUA4_TILAU|nr:uncharacterized protein K437DRAFT_125825 [Tilletiaria anomala UBC 951]KDN45081.1 hypothetical protein K437DRAFT_125825 [Tilletiaria anomala UBC 951]